MEKHLPNWILNLDVEDISFIKKFILASGSLKEIANQYQVSYPTVRLRLDRLIQTIHLHDQQTEDLMISLIKRLSIEVKIDYHSAKLLIEQYKKGISND